MRKIDTGNLDALPGRQLAAGDTFRFRCHPEVACFNRCCRNLNLFLYPYDVLRLRTCLGVSSEVFLDRYVDVVLRPGQHFPEVLLRMTEDDERTCPFLGADACDVYPDRPDTCRGLPVESGLLYDERAGCNRLVHFFRPPDFCRGPEEDTEWTMAAWERDQQAGDYRRMTVRWAELRLLLETDPWGDEGPGGRRGKMTFMAAYNLERFREFVFGSSFLKRYRVKKTLQQRLREDDTRLLTFGFDWIRLFLWNRSSKHIRPR